MGQRSSPSSLQILLYNKYADLALLGKIVYSRNLLKPRIITRKNVSDIIKLPIKAINEDRFEQVKENHLLFSPGYDKNTFKWQKYFGINLITFSVKTLDESKFERIKENLLFSQATNTKFS